MAEPKRFGVCGYLTPEMWKKRINSDYGMFTRMKMDPKDIPGPRLTAGGHISGNLGLREALYLGTQGSLDQIEFFELLADNKWESEAMEYLLTVTNTLPLWKDLYQKIEKAHHCLEDEESIIHHVEVLFEKRKEHLLKRMGLPEDLREDFPEFTQHLEGVFRNFYKEYDHLLMACHSLEEELKQEDQRILRQLGETKEQYPFLFE